MKIKLILVITIGMMGLTSCKKDRVCECTLTTQQGATSTVSEYHVVYKKTKKKIVKNDCVNQVVTYGYANTTVKQTYSDCVIW